MTHWNAELSLTEDGRRCILFPPGVDPQPGESFNIRNGDTTTNGRVLSNLNLNTPEIEAEEESRRLDALLDALADFAVAEVLRRRA